jgi:hypothetical protein
VFAEAAELDGDESTSDSTLTWWSGSRVGGVSIHDETVIPSTGKSHARFRGGVGTGKSHGPPILDPALSTDPEEACPPAPVSDIAPSSSNITHAGKMQPALNVNPL